MKRAAAAASEPSAATAANEALEQGGTAIDATIAGFFAAAAERPGALFAPVQILVAGPGAGARAIDGRSRQPGIGAPRPRGVVEGSAIPPAALAAVPASLAAIAIAHAHDSALSLARLSRPAEGRAKHRGAGGRAHLLARIAAHGAGALQEASIARPLLAAAGRVPGGLLTEDDLASVRPAIVSPRTVAVRGSSPSTSPAARRSALSVPWGDAGTVAARPHELVVAGDHRGVVALLAYAPDDDGVSVPELAVTLPRDAAPVRRGVTREKPGSVRPAAAPFAIVVDDARPIVALGLRSARTPDDEALGAVASAESARGMLEALRDALAGATLGQPLAGVAVVASPTKQEMTAVTL